MRQETRDEPATILELPSGARYELLERIGAGGNGVVYRARELDSGFSRDVCIKRLTLLGPDATRELREEARLLARVRHANVASMLAMGREPSGVPFIVLELVRGLNLRAFSRMAAATSLAPPDAYVADRIAVHVACGVLRALGAVQRALPGLVHRDVSPTNVLVSNEGEVKLTDFGIALAVDRARWTRPSHVKGKLGYMSPEQARGASLDARADLFAVGVILYELLTRRRPWRASGPIDELRAIDEGDMIPIASLRRDLDAGLKNVLERLLEPRAQDRHACADDALRALAPYSAGDLGSLRIAALLREMARRTRDGDHDEDAAKSAHRA